MPNRGDAAEAIDLMFLGAETQNRKEIEESYQETMREIFGLPKEKISREEWDQEMKYKLIIAHGSKDKYLRQVRNDIPAVFTLIELFLRAKRVFQAKNAEKYQETVQESIDILLNEIYMRSYPDYNHAPEIDMKKFQQQVMGGSKEGAY